MRVNEAIILVILVYYKSKDEILDVIHDLNNSNLKVQIYLFLNSSLEDEVKIKLDLKNVTITKFTKNVGFSSAVNSGFTFAIKEDFKYVLLINPDVSFSNPHLLKNLVDFAQINRNNCLISPVHYSDKSFNQLDNNFSKYICNHEFDLEGKMQVQFVNAAFWFLPIQIIEKVGGFDPFFFLYGEDDNYAFRLSEHNIPIYVLKDMKIVHFRKSQIDSQLKTYYKIKYFICHKVISMKCKGYFWNVFYISKFSFLGLLKKPINLNVIIMYLKIYIELLVNIGYLKSRNTLYKPGAFINQANL